METVLLTKNLAIFLTVQMDQYSHSNSRFSIEPWEILVNWQLEKWTYDMHNHVTETDMLDIIQNSGRRLLLSALLFH